MGRLESRDEAEQEFLFLDDEVDFRRPSLVPITEPETPIIKLPETDVPVGEEPERLFPEEPGLKRGGGGGGPLLSDRRELFPDVNGSGSGHVPVPLEELDDVFRTFFRIRPALRLFAE